ncbi:MAG: helix-turn-helix domain-containing protein, partial [Calditrichaeota bacterium]|nr:helix-turn-helix domain-containing protein [Calditrichota bacterium]
MIKENIQHFNSQEAAKILGVNVSTIKRWTDEGKLQCIKSVGGHRKFLMDHL